VRLEGGWVLPLVGPGRVGALQISVRATDLAAPPQVELPADLAVERSEPADAHALVARGTHVQLMGALRLAQVRPAQALLFCITHCEGVLLDATPAATQTVFNELSGCRPVA
jgi:hypothetical protein